MQSRLTTAKKYRIVVDAGHGGTDAGSKSTNGTVFEKDIDLAIVKAMKQLNTDKNLEIILTRDADHFDDLETKAAFMNKQQADVCISIHCSFDEKNVEANGTRIFVVSAENDNGYMDESILLAQSVNGILHHDFANRNIKMYKRGIWILQAAKCPAILIEAGFLSNKNDAGMLASADKQALMAKGILKGIENYLALMEKGK